MGYVEREDIERNGITVEAGFFVLRVHVIPHGDAHRVAGMVDGEIRDAGDRVLKPES